MLLNPLLVVLGEWKSVGGDWMSGRRCWVSGRAFGLDKTRLSEKGRVLDESKSVVGR